MPKLTLTTAITDNEDSRCVSEWVPCVGDFDEDGAVQSGDANGILTFANTFQDFVEKNRAASYLVKGGTLKDWRGACIGK